MNINIQIRNQDFVLHPTGAAYWPNQEILLIADVHLGKISHFRKHGSAIPIEAIAENFRRMDQLLMEFDPEHVMFLGDLFHSSLNLEWDLFADWKNVQNNQFHLIAGNHDIISPLKYEELGIPWYKDLSIDDFHLSHYPEEKKNFFNICGHIHPGFKLRGLGREFLKLPCFFMNENQMVLPAFGEFTGNHFMEPSEGDQIFAITGKEVILVN